MDVREDDPITSDDDFIFDWNIYFVVGEISYVRLTKAEWRRLGLFVRDFLAELFGEVRSRFNSCSSARSRMDLARFFD